MSIKSIAVMITRMEEWNPVNATAANFEYVSLLGPLCRLGVFGREWVRVSVLELFICSQSYEFDLSLADYWSNVLFGTGKEVKG